jgi:hypothetical protein
MFTRLFVYTIYENGTTAHPPFFHHPCVRHSKNTPGKNVLLMSPLQNEMSSPELLFPTRALGNGYGFSNA